jgi:hypothetical protein
MVDRKIDPTTGAIVVESYDNPLVSEKDQVAQNVTIRLRMFYGECFLNTRLGIPYFSDSFTKASRDTIDAMIKATIKETPEIAEILSYTSSFDGPTRTYTINFKASTIYGMVNVNNLNIGG